MEKVSFNKKLIIGIFDFDVFLYKLENILRSFFLNFSLVFISEDIWYVNGKVIHFIMQQDIRPAVLVKHSFLFLNNC